MLEQFEYSQVVPRIPSSTPPKHAESVSTTCAHTVHKAHLSLTHISKSFSPNIPNGGTIIDINPVKDKLTYAIIPNPAIPDTTALKPSLTFCVILLAAMVVSFD